ncbi:uncharacterized membrane protein YhaH (DUF805 family) [Isoptericola sp. CG 20/1183]|uniref:Uncharacterized membrane protein YhaH (DUF805 family) n=1 Tax=Isoptericola halotolerans TaxID=300560 RepID=A0ABX5EG45_9MICO|nr:MULTISPECIES: DUF805 domain-containing protein [Isoptericola]PRZ08470.1 uncharacterized membrane protein YhaH (DUF805 family) [Isoptericola halotolerans]PRZ11083.1 uncharacterized membrane protein YhaH (DUF805 family) [Isoptericola sp. CG 20/1183]
MSFGTAVKTVFSKYATFSGRARRSEFWFWALFVFLVGAVLAIFVSATNGLTIDAETMTPTFGATYFVAALVQLALVLPNLAVTVRRLHDTDRSGFWWFIGLVPLVGPIVLLVFVILEGTRGPNRFGPDPKAVSAAQPTA